MEGLEQSKEGSDEYVIHSAVLLLIVVQELIGKIDVTINRVRQTHQTEGIRVIMLQHFLNYRFISRNRTV